MATHEHKSKSPSPSPSTALTIHALQSHPRTSTGRSKGRPGLRAPTRGRGRARNRRGGGRLTIADAAQLASKAWNTARYLATLINVEIKHFDVATNISPSSTPAIACLTSIAEGSDWNQRDGLSILGEFFFFRFAVSMNASASTTFLRVMLVVDKEQRGADPSVSDVLETASSPNFLIAPLNHFSGNRWLVLMDRLIPMSLNGDSRACVGVFETKFNRHIRYQSSTGASASNWEGNVYLLTGSDQPTNVPSFTYYSRLSFTDN